MEDFYRNQIESMRESHARELERQRKEQEARRGLEVMSKITAFDHVTTL